MCRLDCGGSRSLKKLISSSQFNYRSTLIANGQIDLVREGGVEESLAISSLRRKDEIEYMKILVVVNAIVAAGNSVAAVMSEGGGGSSGDTLQKSMDSLKSVLLPHMEVEKDNKAELAKQILIEEAEKGEIRYKVVGGMKKKPGSVRISKKDR